jgi:hypothetical protein
MIHVDEITLGASGVPTEGRRGLVIPSCCFTLTPAQSDSNLELVLGLEGICFACAAGLPETANRWRFSSTASSGSRGIDNSMAASNLETSSCRPARAKYGHAVSFLPILDIRPNQRNGSTLSLPLPPAFRSRCAEFALVDAWVPWAAAEILSHSELQPAW